jgi:hypothetical protein
MRSCLRVLSPWFRWPSCAGYPRRERDPAAANEQVGDSGRARPPPGTWISTCRPRAWPPAPDGPRTSTRARPTGFGEPPDASPAAASPSWRPRARSPPRSAPRGASWCADTQPRPGRPKGPCPRPGPVSQPPRLRPLCQTPPGTSPGGSPVPPMAPASRTRGCTCVGQLAALTPSPTPTPRGITHSRASPPEPTSRP